MVIQQQIEQKLKSAFQPTYLEVVNESYMHNVPKDSESHFKVHIVSADFEGQLKVKRHQSVYKALQIEMQQIHALALHTQSPSEWQIKSAAPDSPQCLGGSKHDKKIG